MFTNTISQALTALQKTDISTKINDIKLILVWLFNLTPEDRKKIIKMGDKSVSYVRGVLAALKANPAVVPSTFDVTEFEKDMTLYDDLLAILMLLRPLFEGLEDTLVLVGSELIQQANAGYAILKEAAKTNSALTQTVQDLGERYSKAGIIEPTAFVLAPAGNKVLNGVIPGRQFKLVSGGPVTFYRGPVAGGNESKVVGMGNPAKVPTGWTTITIVNNDSANPSVVLVAQE
jgi:hypothetical protein